MTGFPQLILIISHELSTEFVDMFAMEFPTSSDFTHSPRKPVVTGSAQVIRYLLSELSTESVDCLDAR